ncbi:MAG: response regulator transcription factor [Thermoanaerobaculia bacterium]
MAIIDRDRLFARQVGRAFEAEGYEVEWFEGHARALASLRSKTFDLLLVEVGDDGFGVELCRRVRAEALRSDVPLIAATTDPAAHPDALRAGADESVVRTLGMAELIMRARAVMRRASHGWRESAAYADERLEIYPDTMRVIRSGQQIYLSKGESDVLSLLIRHAPASLSVERIRTELSTPAKLLSRSAVEARLKSLRRKVGSDRITNRIGFGYSFMP